MAATQVTPFPELAFSRNEIPMVVLSDNWQAGVPAFSVNKIVFTGAIAIDAILTFAWTAGTAIITAKAVPDDSSYQIPAGDGGHEHVLAIAAILMVNYLFDRDFIVTTDFTGAHPTIIFTALVQGEDYDMTPFAGNVTLTIVTPGISKAKKQQFMHHVQLFIRNVADTGFIQIYNDNVGLDVPENGKTSVDLGEHMLHSYLSSDYPVMNTAVARCLNSIRTYYAKFAQFYGLDPYVRTLSTTGTAVVTKGGLDVQAAAALGITDVLAANLADKTTWRFLRQGSKNKLVTKTQPEWLTWINLSNATLTGMQLEVHVYNDDQTDTTFFTGNAVDAPAYSKWQFKAGFSQLGITGSQSLSKTPIYYTLQLKGDAGYLSAPYAYIIDYRYLEWPRYFIYENSLGGFQTICTTGRGASEFDRNAELAELAGDMASTASAGSIIEANITWQDKYSVNYGYRRASPRTLNMLRDFFASPCVYLYSNGKLIPVGISTKNVKDAGDGNNVYASTFEYTTRYTEKMYTEEQGLLDESVNDLLNSAGTPVPYVPPVGSTVPAGGVIRVLHGDTHLATVGGNQVYTAPLYLAGRPTGYAIYSSQMARCFFPDEVSYNMGAGSFTILVDQFQLQLGDYLLVWPLVLDPAGLFT